MLALIAGGGRLPEVLFQRCPDALVCELAGFPSGLAESPLSFRIETLVTFLSELRDRGVGEVCFAGTIRRPALDPAAVDAATMPLVPRMMAALQAGDDAALRTVIGFFEEAGFAVRAPQDIAPELLPPAGVLSAAAPGERDEADAARGAEVLAGLSALDIGQSCVVAGGQVLSVETSGGTDWMLDTLAGERRPPGATGGVYCKAPKAGQDRRIDLPVIGPETMRGLAAAALGGAAIEAGGVMLLDRDDTVAAADEAGLFLWVREP